MKAIITVGISASGKTTWAHEEANRRVCPVLSRDSERWKIMRDVKGVEPSWANWKWKWEDQVTANIEKRLADCVEFKLDIIIADTNLNKAKREALQAKLEALGYEVEIKVFHISFEEALKRDTARKDGVGFWVLNEQWETYHAEFGEPKYENPTDLPTCVIVDIDGTAALMNGKRGPFELDKVHLDDVNEVCRAMVNGLFDLGHKIIFLSGREGSDVCRDLTHRWLLDNYGVYHMCDQTLYMRPAKDQRPDSIIKRELFDEHIRGKYHVMAVLDDRPRVARMWRNLGLNVVQFGNPYVDF